MEDEETDAVDREIDALRAGVGRLKGLSRTIQEEHRSVADLTTRLEGALEAAAATLKATRKRLDRAYRQNKSNHLLHVLLFALACFFLLYFWSKVRTALAWIL